MAVLNTAPEAEDPTGGVDTALVEQVIAHGPERITSATAVRRSPPASARRDPATASCPAFERPASPTGPQRGQTRIGITT